jgi:hypothetical protein
VVEPDRHYRVLPGETAERIPDATLRLYDGVGHPVSKTHKRRFEEDVLAFLDG